MWLFPFTRTDLNTAHAPTTPPPPASARDIVVCGLLYADVRTTWWGICALNRTAALALPEKEAWRPWTVGNVPAGYVTTYSTAGQSKSPPLATDNLLENTDGSPREGSGVGAPCLCSLAVAACYLLFTFCLC